MSQPLNNWHLRKSLNTHWKHGWCLSNTTIQPLVMGLHNLQRWYPDFLLSFVFYFLSFFALDFSPRHYLSSVLVLLARVLFSLPSKSILLCEYSFLLNSKPTLWASVKPILSHNIISWPQSYLSKMNLYVTRADTDWLIYISISFFVTHLILVPVVVLLKRSYVNLFLEAL